MTELRYRRILWFFARVLINEIVWDIIFPRIGLRRLSRRTRADRMRKAAAAFSTLAIQMGGVLIKVGQFLSARLDVLPREVTDELSGLQDEVRPESLENVRKVIEAEFGAPLMDMFSEFDQVPLASASIGQVHRARLKEDPAKNGDNAVYPPVVVKVQRPTIQKIVEIDLRAIRVVGGWLQQYPPIRKRANVPALIEEFSRTLYEEIDYLAEGKNAETFAENFKDQRAIRVPKVIWSHTTRRVLTLEDVQAIKITDYPAIEAAGIDRAQVANQLFKSYLQQFFEDKFFHADPHPGNMFVMPVGGDGTSSTGNFRLTFVDFGMVGRVSPKLFTGLQELLLAVGLRDGSRVVKAYQILGVLLPGADLDLISRASDRVFESFWGKTAPEMMSMHQEEAAQFVNEFGNLMYEMPFQVPENLILLGRCLGILSGICTGLDPDFNIWTNLAPYAGKLVQDESGNRFGTVINEIGDILRSLVTLPKKTEALLNRIEQGKLTVSVPEIKDKIAHLDRTQSKLVGAILFSAFLLGTIQLHHESEAVPALILGLAAGLSLVWTLFIA
jgi:predicted unusual protein kinase regulating ubiquinone biosynthesis (AarF/ABC1/UbiB family)